MSNNDEVSDFDPQTQHLWICNVAQSRTLIPPGCNRDCDRRLFDLAVRLENLLNPRADDARIDAREFIYPECEGHNEVQHRDGLGPWCSRCGWHRGTPATPPLKVGKSSEERIAAGGGQHRPWSPETGYQD